MTPADNMKVEALAIFDGSECPQEVRDVIEWFHASMLVQQEQAYPLPDSLYPGSKDWMAGGYPQRVEWLHQMYEAKKQEQAGFTVSLGFLKRVQESLSDYCGHLDWGNADMDLMDEVEAMLDAAPKQGGDKP